MRYLHRPLLLAFAGCAVLLPACTSSSDDFDNCDEAKITGSFSFDALDYSAEPGMCTGIAAENNARARPFTLKITRTGSGTPASYSVEVVGEPDRFMPNFTRTRYACSIRAETKGYGVVSADPNVAQIPIAGVKEIDFGGDDVLYFTETRYEATSNVDGLPCGLGSDAKGRRLP